MSKPLYMTEDMIRETLEDAEKQLRSMKLANGTQTLNINYFYPPRDPKHPELDYARVTFTTEAWKKQSRLISDFSSEVGWHGICKRDPEDFRHFTIEDILVFPQTVSGSTVTPSQEEYESWNTGLSKEQIQNCRYHGHSHVNMGTSPSATDNKLQADMLGRLDGDGFTEEMKAKIAETLGATNFYIFMIWNKRGEHHVRIYDMWTNHFYEGNEVIIEHADPDGLEAFMQDAKEKVKSYSFQPRSGAIAANSTVTEKRDAAKEAAESDDSKGVLDDYAPTDYPYGYGDRWDWWRKYYR